MYFEASTFVVAIHGALDEHTHFWMKQIHFHKSSVYVAYEGLWTQVVLFLEALTRYTIWKTIFKHVKPEAPRRYKYTTFVKTVFFKLKMGLPIQRLLNHNYQGPYPPGNLKFGLLHNEDSSKAASLAISNVRFDVMLGSPVPFPCHHGVCGHRFWCKGSKDFIEKTVNKFLDAKLEILHLHGQGFGSWFGRFVKMQKHYVYIAFLNCRGQGDRKEKHWNMHRNTCFAAPGIFVNVEI